MSTTAYQVINAIPGIEDLRYLELGVCGGGTFDRVLARDKVSVDVARFPPSLHPTYLMPTDEFFAGPGRVKFFDVVFIDACHEVSQVVRDFTNAAARLKPDGIILLHDLLPPDESYTSPSFCHDGFRFLIWLAQSGVMEYVVEDGDYGLTAVRAHPGAGAGYGADTYRHLRDALKEGWIRPVPLEQMMETVSGWRAP